MTLVTSGEIYPTTNSGTFTNPTNAYSLDGVFATAIGTPAASNPYVLLITKSGTYTGTVVTPNSTLNISSYNDVSFYTLADLRAGLVQTEIDFYTTTTTFVLKLSGYNFSSIPDGSVLQSLTATITHKIVGTTYSVDTISVNATYTPPPSLTGITSLKGITSLIM
jgi:hypothetical protein